MQQYMITTAPNYNPDPVSYQQQMNMINGGDGYMYPQQQPMQQPMMPMYQQPVYQQPMMQPMYQPQPMYGYPQPMMMNPPQPCIPVINGQYAIDPNQTQGTFTEACQQLQGYQPRYALKEQMDRYANAGIMPQYNGQQNPLDYMTEASKKVQEIEKQTGFNPFNPYANSPVYNAVINNNQQSMPQPRMSPYQQFRAQAYGPQYANITNQFVPQQQFLINPQYQYNYNYGYYGSPMQQYQAMQQPKYTYDPNAMMKIKMRIGFGTFGKEFTDAELDQMINPQVPVRQMTNEEIEIDREYRLMRTYDYYMHMPPIMTQEQAYLVQLANQDARIREQYNSMDPIQFLNEELPRLQLQQWERENCVPFGNNTNQVYSDDKYVMALMNKMNIDRKKQQETGNVPYQPQYSGAGVNVNVNDANSLLNNPHYTDPTDSHYKDYKQPITSTGQPPAMPNTSLPLKNGTVEVDARVMMDKLNNDEIHQRINGLMNTIAGTLPGLLREQEIAAQKAGLTQALNDPKKMAEHNKTANEFIKHFAQHPEQVEQLNAIDTMLLENGGKRNV